jgi:hypothetical protein
MPYSHVFEPERKIVRIIADGACDFEATRGEFQALAAEPDFVNARTIRYQPSNAEIVELAETWIRLAALRPVAIVVSNALHVGLANMFAILAGLHGASVSVFRGVSDAEAWLSPAPPSDRED